NPPPCMPLVPAKPSSTVPEPALSTFFPVRSGLVKLVNVHIVDCFGQMRKPIDSTPPLGQPTGGRPPDPSPSVVVSASMPPASAPWQAAFSPRLVQPARLNFLWQPGGEQSVGPVCGWIIANYLEQSLAVFSALGKPLGAIESVLPAHHAA